MNIKVKMTRSSNASYYGVSTNSVVTLEIEEYLKNVVPNECSDYYPAAALRAQAIASRTFAMYRVSVSPRSSTYDIYDNTNDQSFKAGTAASNSTSAVNYTSGKVLTSNGIVFKSFFHASSGGETLSAASVFGNYPCQPAQNDPWTTNSGYGVDGHRVGLSQRGAQWAANNSKTYLEILAFYYPDSSVTSDYATSSGTSSYTTWAAKYGNNTFVNSSTYSGNVFRVQRDLNRWGVSPQLTEDGKWGSLSAAATTQFQNAYSSLTADGLCGPNTKSKLYEVTGQYYD